MRTVIFGVDGLTFRVLHPLIERGMLPHFRKIQTEGCEAILESKYPPLTPPGWMSLSTGLITVSAATAATSTSTSIFTARACLSSKVIACSNTAGMSNVLYNCVDSPHNLGCALPAVPAGGQSHGVRERKMGGRRPDRKST